MELGIENALKIHAGGKFSNELIMTRSDKPIAANRVIPMLQPIFFVLFMLTSFTAWANDEIKCNPDGSQVELNECARNEFTKADSELNKTFQNLIKNKAADKVFISKIRLAQKAWIAFRDADLDARFACSENDVSICWGSMYPMLFFSRKTELTRERNKQLLEILEDGAGQ